MPRLRARPDRIWCMGDCSRRRTAFVATANAFRAGGGRGLNVTLPFKGEAVRFATVLAERARAAQAVNTLKFDGDVILGDNTDGVGLVNDLVRNLGCAITGGAFCCWARAGRRAA